MHDFRLALCFTSLKLSYQNNNILSFKLLPVGNFGFTVHWLIPFNIVCDDKSK